MKRILIYYKYVEVTDPETEKNNHLELCTRLKLTGRVILATEGINGTVCGTLEATQAYMEAMNKHSLFNGMDFKWSDVDGQFDYFPKMQIKVKPEIVHLGVDPKYLTPAQGGKHLTPQEVHELMLSNEEDLVVLDTRNIYEWKIGTFKNAIKPDINHFREFPEFIDKHLDEFKDKKVLMFCTAGVRCERATAYLKVKDVAKEVYQIQGGIQRYTEQYPDGFFRGKNYVFDNRIAVKVNEDVLGACDVCGTSCDEYTNCLSAKCNKHFISCNECLEVLKGTCSQECKQHIELNESAKRPPLAKVTTSSVCSKK